MENWIEEFNKQFVQSYPGDSGFNGGDPQEPDEQISAYPEEIRDFICTKKSEWEKASFERGLREVLEMIPDGIRLNPPEHYKSTTDIKKAITKKFNL